MVPEVIPWSALAALGLDQRRYRPYAGIKEQVTLADFEPDPTVIETLGLDAARPIAVLRPPATMSLYHRGIENTLFDEVLDHLRASDAQVVLLPRTPEQARGFDGVTGVTVPATPGRRPVAGLRRGPRGQRRGHHEPRGGAARHAHLDHVRRRAWAPWTGCSSRPAGWACWSDPEQLVVREARPGRAVVRGHRGRGHPGDPGAIVAPPMQHEPPDRDRPSHGVPGGSASCRPAPASSTRAPSASHDPWSPGATP